MDYKIIHSDSTLPLLEVFNSEHNTWLLRWQGRKKAEYIECLHQGKPTLEEVKHIVLEWYNAETDKRILSGFRYEGHLVWLSRENQINYKAAYDLAFQLGGQMGTLPATFKLGTDEEPHFLTFATLEDLQSFYLSTVQHIKSCYLAGWQAKRKNRLVSV